MIHQPLSYSQNVYQDLSIFVREALAKLGTPSEKLEDFNAFSTIQIDLEDNLSINISLQDDRLWLWALLPMSEEQLVSEARTIFPVITEPVEYIETGQLVFGKCENGYELKALINLESLNNNKLKEIIASFHSLLSKIKKGLSEHNSPNHHYMKA
ncbi:InvB/SpaK family type III secretion system chaperone [Spartinivicinus ruber]|uniref:InvB/SpaK family type III secretion system chaperone n=1 Tax=Spartinivicinus ruber TaxID=2683272 RepID=UPI0013D0EF37|nr:hypothetical protein [Spartinivicinus ruber]